MGLVSSRWLKLILQPLSRTWRVQCIPCLIRMLTPLVLWARRLHSSRDGGAMRTLSDCYSRALQGSLLVQCIVPLSALLYGLEQGKLPYSHLMTMICISTFLDFFMYMLFSF